MKTDTDKVEAVDRVDYRGQTNGPKDPIWGGFEGRLDGSSFKQGHGSIRHMTDAELRERYPIGALPRPAIMQVAPSVFHAQYCVITGYPAAAASAPSNAIAEPRRAMPEYHYKNMLRGFADVRERRIKELLRELAARREPDF